MTWIKNFSNHAFLMNLLNLFDWICMYLPKYWWVALFFHVQALKSFPCLVTKHGHEVIRVWPCRLWDGGGRVWYRGTWGALLKNMQWGYGVRCVCYGVSHHGNLIPMVTPPLAIWRPKSEPLEDIFMPAIKSNGLRPWDNYCDTKTIGEN